MDKPHDIVLASKGRVFYEVHCFGNRNLTYKDGDLVPDIGGHETFAIFIKRNTYVNVFGGVIFSVGPRVQEDTPTFDIWGHPLDVDNLGFYSMLDRIA